jgi:UDP-3-O-[3-hydroxymyristoyl] N-acetylglucosamine deacetylase
MGGVLTDCPDIGRLAEKGPGALSISYQHTVSGPATCTGVGLHSGQRVRVTLRPAPVNTGIVFVRSDIEDDNRVRATAAAVTQTRLCTVIANDAGVSVATIEHLMAALAALDVDNALVELDGPEIPIMDGSALPFVQLVDRAGRRLQEAERQYIEILETVEVVEGDKVARLSPSDRFEMAFTIGFNSAAIGRQSLDLTVTETSFRRDLADCRTFGFLHEVNALREAGLARGGSLDNAVVIDGDRVLNPEGLRRPDEFVRHKALDAVGDLYVLGAPIIGRFEGVYGGHAMNNLAVRALLARPSAYRLGAVAVDLARAV